MEAREFDSVTLKDGRTGTVCEVWGEGEAFEVDFPRPMEGSDHLMTFDTETVRRDEIAAAERAAWLD